MVLRDVVDVGLVVVLVTPVVVPVGLVGVGLVVLLVPVGVVVGGVLGVVPVGFLVEVLVPYLKHCGQTPGSSSGHLGSYLQSGMNSPDQNSPVGQGILWHSPSAPPVECITELKLHFLTSFRVQITRQKRRAGNVAVRMSSHLARRAWRRRLDREIEAKWLEASRVVGAWQRLVRNDRRSDRHGSGRGQVVLRKALPVEEVEIIPCVEAGAGALLVGGRVVRARAAQQFFLLKRLSHTQHQH